MTFIWPEMTSATAIRYLQGAFGFAAIDGVPF